MERAGHVSHILWQTHDPFLCGFIILCERLRVSKGTALCGESHLKLHYGHASAQITGEKSLHREWITHVCPVHPHLSEWIMHICPDVRPHLSEWITHVCLDVRPHLSEWITHVSPDVRPHLLENLLYKVYMIVFTCFLRNSYSINEVGSFSPEWYQEDFRGTVYHCQSELGLC